MKIAVLEPLGISDDSLRGLLANATEGHEVKKSISSAEALLYLAGEMQSRGATLHRGIATLAPGWRPCSTNHRASRLVRCFVRVKTSACWMSRPKSIIAT